MHRIDLPAGASVSFHPGGYHLMFMHAKHDIVLGPRIPVTFEFPDGQKIRAQFEVRGATAR